MADLDDFFTKRDKKKPKGKKFETTEDVAKVLETKAKERKKAENTKYTSQTEDDDKSSQPGLTKEDDEWKEVEENKPDFSGLKIHDMVLDDNEDEGNEREENESTSKEGPWNKQKKEKEKEIKEIVVEIAASSNNVDESSNKMSENVDEPSSISTTDTNETAQIEETKGSNENIDNITSNDETTISDDKSENPVQQPAQSSKPKYVPPSLRKAKEAEAAAEAAAATSTAKSPALAPTSSLASELPKSTGPPTKYVPPGRRSGAVSSSSSSAKPRKVAAAPDINDQDYFPDLG